MLPVRAYGLTADEWFHLASEGMDSEVQPCCGNIGDVRDLLREMMPFASCEDDIGWRQSIGKRLEQVIEADGEGHGLQNRETFPLLHRVLNGIKQERREEDERWAPLRAKPTE